LDIGPVPKVEPPELDEQQGETEEQDDADLGVDGPRELPAAEDDGQEEQRGVEHRQSGQGEQNQRQRGHPMIDPGCAAVPIDRDRFAAMEGVTRID
jgi:hypothetical protein